MTIPHTLSLYTHAVDVKQNTNAFYLSLRVNFMSLKAINPRGGWDIINPFSQLQLFKSRCNVRYFVANVTYTKIHQAHPTVIVLLESSNPILIGN